MNFDPEGRRAVAQFLNGVAVAIIGVGAIAPILAGNVSWKAFAAAILGLGLGVVAVWAAKGQPR